MPELPEVEANLRNLRSWSRGRRIREVVPPPGRREMGGMAPARFSRILKGRRVEEAVRRGKWMLLRLSGGAGLGLHLGMTGKILHGRQGEDAPRFLRAVFRFDNGEEVYFVDQRRFGKLLAAAHLEDLEHAPEISEIGPDALEELSTSQLAAALQGTRRTVKEAIMDQKVMAGVGNLYATEALWHARIHPATPAQAVGGDPGAVRALLQGIRKALQAGIRFYKRPKPPKYVEEGGPNPFNAYDHVGEPCPRCGTPIQAARIGGRTSAFCPKEQVAPRGKKRMAARRKVG